MTAFGGDVGQAPPFCRACGEVESYCQCPDPLWRSVPKRPDVSGTRASGHVGTDKDALLEGLVLLDVVERFVRRHVVLPSDHDYVAVVAWCAHAHCITAFDSTPRLAFMAPEKRSGKTRGLEIVEALVPNPLRVANVTVATLFRLIDGPDPPTVMLDECDAIWTPRGENEALRALINAGHRRGSDAARMVGEGAKMQAKRFSTFAPVALAGIGNLPDTIEDRAVVVRMQRRRPSDLVEPWRFRTSLAEGNELRDQLGELAAKHADALADLEPVPEVEVIDRMWDTWEPLIAVAEVLGDERWTARVRAAARAYSRAEAAAVPSSAGIRLLADLRTVWPDDGGGVWQNTEDLLAGLHALPDGPWSEDPPLTGKRLASLLRPYGIRPRQSGDRTSRGYDRGAVRQAWDRYLPRPFDSSEDLGDERTDR